MRSGCSPPRERQDLSGISTSTASGESKTIHLSLPSAVDMLGREQMSWLQERSCTVGDTPWQRRGRAFLFESDRGSMDKGVFEKAAPPSLVRCSSSAGPSGCPLARANMSSAGPTTRRWSPAGERTRRRCRANRPGVNPGRRTRSQRPGESNPRREPYANPDTALGGRRSEQSNMDGPPPDRPTTGPRPDADRRERPTVRPRQHLLPRTSPWAGPEPADGPPMGNPDDPTGPRSPTPAAPAQ